MLNKCLVQTQIGANMRVIYLIKCLMHPACTRMSYFNEFIKFGAMLTKLLNLGIKTYKLNKCLNNCEPTPKKGQPKHIIMPELRDITYNLPKPKVKPENVYPLILTEMRDT